MLVVGVDGGGSKTQAFAMNDATGVVASATTAACNPSTVGWQNAVEQVRDAVNSVVAQISGVPSQPSQDREMTLCAALAGMGRALDREQMAKDLQAIWPAATVLVTSDAHAALSAGTQGQPGAVLIAGTGAIALASDADGQVTRVGGFGYLLGDEGSGFALGRAALSHVLAASEGRSAESALTVAAQRYLSDEGVLSASQSENPTDWLWALYQNPHLVTVIAGFARIVLMLRRTDDVARTLVNETLSAQVALIKSLERRSSHGSLLRLWVTGGLFHVETGLIAELQERLPSVLCAPLTVLPSAGAALLALEHSAKVRGSKVSEQAFSYWLQGATGGKSA